jgi:hypothetical protein
MTRACSSAVRARSLYLRGRWFKSIQAHHKHMPFLFIGIILLIVSVLLLRWAMKLQNKELIVGFYALIAASVILIVFFGIFYNVIVP